MSNENTQPIQNLQRINIELNLAYEATVEGFARALEMREGEPTGHTHQVTEITTRLAKVVGVDDETLPHLRRGALLHDIGKLGVPESILHKSGTLTDEEWKAVRLHPQIAYALLSPIVYLYPALDIPYCHHEKWDGSGYPQGLKGTQIPLAARIFAWWMFGTRSPPTGCSVKPGRMTRPATICANRPTRALTRRWWRLS